MSHWKEAATRCAVIGCERTRNKGWSTCSAHYSAGKSLYGAGRIAPIDPNTLKAVCGFCAGKPVGNAATWVDGKPRPPAPCPRCGETNG